MWAELAYIIEVILIISNEIRTAKHVSIGRLSSSVKAAIQIFETDSFSFPVFSIYNVINLKSISEVNETHLETKYCRYIFCENQFSENFNPAQPRNQPKLIAPVTFCNIA